MTTSDDPFEAAARHEEAARLRREARLATARATASGQDSRGVLVAWVVFLGPYAIWASLRAADHPWGPGVGRALTSFFFGSGAWFAFYTCWLLFLFWVWAISALNGGRRRPLSDANG